MDPFCVPVELEDKELMAYGEGAGGREMDPGPALSSTKTSSHSSSSSVSQFLRLGGRRDSTWRDSLLVLCLADMLLRCFFLEAVEADFFLRNDLPGIGSC